MADDLLFEVTTRLGVRVRTTAGYWRRIVHYKHPVLEGKLEAVRQAVQDPQEIRRSRRDPEVHLFYRREAGTEYYICAVAKHLGDEGFLITAYRTDRIKEGELLWMP